MRLDPGRSEDIEDRRSQGGSGGGGGMRMGVGGLIVLGILSFIFRTDLISPFLGGGGGGAVSSAPDPQRDAAEAPLADTANRVITDVNNVWEQVFAQAGRKYPRTPAVIFRDGTDSACGAAQSAMGPFYCPGDQKVYIDLAFYEELKQRFGAPGDFAQAYVLAHEVGHHVQNVTGTERQVRAAQRQNPGAQNQLSVLMELQADCYAGIWGKTTNDRNKLDPSDAEEAIKAAAAIGDDRLQKQAGARVNPESFTHGSSQQRMEWFKRGFETADLKACDTFGGQLR
jgi:uncharacterized protein